MSISQGREVEFLILGAGWTSTFLIPLLQQQRITYDSTSTTGRGNTHRFVFDPDSDDLGPYLALPPARTVLITFPLKGVGQSKKLTELYWKTHAPTTTNWIQLGSTGIYDQAGWNDHNGEYDRTAPRAVAEDELIGLGGVVLNLAGLYGGDRDPKKWVGRVARTKDQLAEKGALHLIHGKDVARAIVGMHHHFAPGDRWIVTDRHVYDWWDLVDTWEAELTEKWQGEQQQQQGMERPDYRRWVQELMEENGVRALPRDNHQLGRLVDSCAFWKYIKDLPVQRLPR